MIINKIISILCFVFFVIGGFAVFGAAEDPLRGVELRRHLTGPEVKPGSLKGKVVLFEYWGYG